MDMKILREKFYEEWVNHSITFRGDDGLDYTGLLEDWYEDGTLIFDGLSATKPLYQDTGDTEAGDFYDEKVGRFHHVERVDDLREPYLLVNSLFIRFVHTRTIVDSDKMTGEVLRKRNKRWERARAQNC